MLVVKFRVRIIFQNEGQKYTGRITMVELGISTFGETTELEGTGQTYSHSERIRQLVAEIELADKVGLDVYGIGEHH